MASKAPALSPPPAPFPPASPSIETTMLSLGMQWTVCGRVYPVFATSSSRSITYQLDLHAVEALAAQAAHIRDQLAQLPLANIATSAEDAQAVREQRGRLTTTLARTEAQLDEAQAGLAAATSTTGRAG